MRNALLKRIEQLEDKAGVDHGDGDGGPRHDLSKLNCSELSWMRERIPVDPRRLSEIEAERLSHMVAISTGQRHRDGLQCPGMPGEIAERGIRTWRRCGMCRDQRHHAAGRGDGQVKWDAP